MGVYGLTSQGKTCIPSTSIAMLWLASQLFSGYFLAGWAYLTSAQPNPSPVVSCMCTARKLGVLALHSLVLATALCIAAEVPATHRL